MGSRAADCTVCFAAQMKKFTKAKVKHNFEEKYRPDPRIQIRSSGQIPQQTLITSMSPARERMEIPAPAIGIDLGTTTSCVAVFRDGKVEIISNEQGNRTTPSYVAFTEAGLLVGDAAKSQLSSNPNNSIYGAKRLVGRTFEDWTAQVDVNHLPFEVLDNNTKLKIKVQHRGENKTFFPQQISSMVFRKMKEVAEAYLGMTIDQAVVSVPACYNIAQRQATMDAGAIAGFTKLRLVNETSAAAIAYAVDKKITDECKVLIFSLGSGSFGASIIFIKDGICDVKSTAGVVHLGGQDFDNRLVDHFVREFRRKYNRDLTSDKRALMRLRTSCELAKINLSSSNQARIEIDSIFEGIDFHTSITRACFEELNEELFRSIIKPLEKLFQDSHLDKTQIHEIILVGGSTRIPKIQEILRAFFFGKELNKSINLDEAVAYGAAIYAAILQKNNCEELQKFQLQDVAQFSFGIEAPGGNMFNLITRNTKIPTEQKLVLTRNPVIDHTSKSVYSKKTKHVQERSHFRLIKIFEGESAKTSNNNHLENLSFNYFSVKNDIELTFSIDFNGMLNVKTSEKGTNKIVMSVRFTINDYFSKDDIERMIKEARSYITEMDNKDESNTASNRLEMCCFNVLSKIENENIMRKVSDNSKAVLMEKCNEILHLVDGDQLSKDEECEQKQEELKRLFNNIIIQSYKEVVTSPETVPGFSGSNPEDNFTRENCPQTDTSKNFAVDLIQF